MHANRPLAAPLLLLAAVSLCPMHSLQAAVYRCPGSAGEVEFRQTPCPGGPGEAISLTGYRTGEGLRPGERAWLEQRRTQRPAPRRTSAKAVRSSTDVDQAERQAYRCRDKRARLDALESEMRQGYKAGRGESLRRRRSRYQDYLRTFCR